jgi:hypothetical protein
LQSRWLTQVNYWSSASVRTAFSLFAGETCPQSCSLAMAVVLSPVYTDVTWKWPHMPQYIYIYIYWYERAFCDFIPHLYGIIHLLLWLTNVPYVCLLFNLRNPNFKSSLLHLILPILRNSSLCNFLHPSVTQFLSSANITSGIHQLSMFVCVGFQKDTGNDPACNRCFRGIYRLQLHGRKIKAVASRATTRRYIPEDKTLHNHRCQNLKTYIANKYVWISPKRNVVLYISTKQWRRLGGHS